MRRLALIILSAVFLSGCTQTQTECGIEQCHGLDLTCGPDVPDVCTAEYRLGDFCQEYFKCENVNGACQANPNARFGVCKSCVQRCEVFSDPMKAFECENACRTGLETSCRTDADCSCGVHVDTGDCFYGNKAFVDADRQCPDFCNGIGANLVIKCTDYQCRQSVA